MKKSRILLLFCVLAIAAVVGLFIFERNPARSKTEGAANSSTNETRVVLTLGFRPGVVVDLALLQAVERGDLAKHGFEITLKPYGRADLIFAALNSGEIQGSLGVPLEPLLDQAAKGAYPCRGYLVWYFDDKTPYDGLIVRTDAGVDTLNDLSGKAVGSHPSKQVTFFVSRFLPGATVKPYNPAAPLTSLDSGDMAAAYVLEPFLSIVRTKGKYRILELNLISRRVFDSARVPAALSVLSSAWMDAHPAEAAEFVRLARAAYLDDAKKRDTNLVVKILTQPRFGYTADVAAQVAEPSSSFPENLDKAQFQRFVAVLKEGGLFSGEVSLNKLLYVPPAK
jgi:ABC-type nitrate/sulfonate/bicarbonate transport system substrate-binding protein